MRDITIWNNDICEMAEALRADDPELYSDMDDLYDIAADMVDANLEDECCNLDIDMPHNLILTGTLQRWDGPRSAYKLLQTNNIGQALSQMPGLFDGDNSIIVKLEDNEVVLLQTGHDNPTNPSRFLLRALTKDWDEIPDDSPETLLKYSQSVAKPVANVYGV